MNNIIFTSVNDIAVTCIGSEVIGKMVGDIIEGTTPTYGMSANDMGLSIFIMDVNYA